MKKQITLLLFMISLVVHSQRVESIETILRDSISIRAIELFDNKVWYVGTKSKFGYVDVNNPKNQKQIKISDKNLQFRTLAQNKNDFYTINIESLAYFYKINKNSLKSEIIYIDSVKTAFYDALHFVNNDLAFAFSDPDESFHLTITSLDTKKNQFHKNKARKGNNYFKLNEGEVAFAASNSNLSSFGQYLLLGTGGGSSRVFRINKETWFVEAFESNFIQDSETQGIYSIDFYNDKFGIAVGGDYKKQEANINNIATTIDGGMTWQIQASGKNYGYMTCVKIKPKSRGKEIIAVGDQHISYSKDFGKSWKKISDEKGLYNIKWINQNTVVLAGKDRIVKMKIK